MSGHVPADYLPDWVQPPVDERVPTPELDQLQRLEREVAALAAIHKPSASEGELEAARVVGTAFADAGADTYIERERAHGNYWLPLGLLTAAGAAAGLLARSRRRRNRLAGAALGAGAAAAIWDDLTGGEHHFRRLLPKRWTYNVIASMGPEDADRTVVFVSHHDAAKSGTIFNPAIPAKLAPLRKPPRPGKEQHSPPVMWPVFAGPLLAAAGAALGSKKLARAGTALSAGSVLAFADIGRSAVVPAANDNISGVVCLQELARDLEAVPPQRTRVILLSTGSEESLMEGMHRFARRYFPDLPRESTFFMCVDTVGSDRLLVLRGEGMLKLYRYPQAALDTVDAVAEELGLEMEPGVVLRNATDGLYALKAGYPSAMLGSMSPEHGAPANYHWHTDTPENVNYRSVADAARLCFALAHRLDQRWLDSRPR